MPKLLLEGPMLVSKRGLALLLDNNVGGLLCIGESCHKNWTSLIMS